jgi:hypothetical protein
MTKKCRCSISKASKKKRVHSKNGGCPHNSQNSHGKTNFRTQKGDRLFGEALFCDLCAFCG